MKIACYGHRDWAGVNSALAHLSKVTGIPYLEDEDFRGYDYVILGGYAFGGHNEWIRMAQTQGAKVALYWCSSFGQMGLSPDLCEFDFLQDALKRLEKGEIDRIFVGDSKVEYPLQASYPQLKDRIQTLPFPFAYWKYAKYDKTHDWKHIVFLTPKRPYKNVANQLIALALLKRWNPRFKVTVNELRLEYLKPTRMFPLECEMVKWLDEDEYLTLLGSAGLSLQATYTEVCNYAAMTSMACGTPTLLSYAPSWVRCIKNDEVKKFIINEELDDPVSLAAKINNLPYALPSWTVRGEIIRIFDEHNHAVMGIIDALSS